MHSTNTDWMENTDSYNIGMLYEDDVNTLDWLEYNCSYDLEQLYFSEEVTDDVNWFEQVDSYDLDKLYSEDDLNWLEEVDSYDLDKLYSEDYIEGIEYTEDINQEGLDIMNHQFTQMGLCRHTDYGLFQSSEDHITSSIFCEVCSEEVLYGLFQFALLCSECFIIVCFDCYDGYTGVPNTLDDWMIWEEANHIPVPEFDLNGEYSSDIDK